MNRIDSTSGGRPAGPTRRRAWRLCIAAVLALLAFPLFADGTILKGCQKPCAELAGATVRATSLAPHDTVALLEKALLALLRLGQGRVSDALDALHDYKARLNALAAAKKPRISARDHARLTASVDAALACVQGFGNVPPVANAGPDQTVLVGATVQLSGSKSSDVDGDPLSYAWSVVSRPAGSAATLTSPSSVNTSFLVDLPGTYVVQLLVHDGTVESGPATVRISTVNSPPVASAGPDQTVTVGSTVQLDGAASFDVDGDPLSFEWTLASRPPGSQATLTDPTAEQPAFIADVGGTYVVQLVVNDGLVDSQAAAVRIDTQNSPPVSDPGPDQIVPMGSLVQLDASGSSDADGDPLTFRWSFTTRPAGSAAILSDPTGARPTFIADVVGTYVVQLVVNDGFEDGAPDTVMVTAEPVNQAPGVDAGPDSTITLPADSVGLGGSVSDDGLPGGQLAITWSLASGPDTVTFDSPSAAATTARFSASGVYVLRLTADDGALSSSDLVTITVNPAPAGNQPPVVSAGAPQTITLPAAAALTGTVSDDGRPDPPAGLTTAWSVVSGPGTVTFGDGQALATTATFSTAGSYVLRLSAFDGQLTTTADVTITVNLPPDPATVAPPVDPSVVTTLKAATEFLYTGANPIQTGVAPGTIDPKRAAVLRGRVLDGNGAPLAGVTITILGHPEFGQTLTRADGMFDLAVNGGGQLTIHYEKAGVLPAQRQAATSWSDYAILPDVVLIALDPAVTVIDLGAGVAMQVARGSVMTDADGTRQATLLVPQGTTAELRLPGGGMQPLTTLSVRATEYTVGPNGPAGHARRAAADERLHVRGRAQRRRGAGGRRGRGPLQQPAAVLRRELPRLPRRHRSCRRGATTGRAASGRRPTADASSGSWASPAAWRTSTSTATAWPTPGPRWRRSRSPPPSGSSSRCSTRPARACGGCASRTSRRGT